MSVTEEADRQRLISTITFRATAVKGTLHRNLPKSGSSVTLFSELHPLITQNPPYQENISSPVMSTKTCMLESFWDISSSSSTNAKNLKFTRSLPCRIHKKEMYGTLQEQALRESAKWEEQELKANLKDSIEEFAAGMGTPSGHNMKLSVREQARQFEQQTLANKIFRDSRAFLDLDDLLAIIKPQYNAGFVGKDEPPCIQITGTAPPPVPTQQSSPPVLRRFSFSISSYVTVEPCEIWLELIPDEPDSRPPSPTLSVSCGPLSPTLF